MINNLDIETQLKTFLVAIYYTMQLKKRLGIQKLFELIIEQKLMRFSMKIDSMK